MYPLLVYYMFIIVHCMSIIVHRMSIIVYCMSIIVHRMSIIVHCMSIIVHRMSIIRQILSRLRTLENELYIEQKSGTDRYDVNMFYNVSSFSLVHYRQEPI